jgi:hypothetical protein
MVRIDITVAYYDVIGYVIVRYMSCSPNTIPYFIRFRQVTRSCKIIDWYQEDIINLGKK